MTVISTECSGCTNSLICKLVKESGERPKHQRRDNKGCVRLSQISKLDFPWRNCVLCEAPHEQPINRTNPEYCSCVLIPTYVCINVGPLTISILHIKHLAISTYYITTCTKYKQKYWFVNPSFRRC